MTSFNNLGLDKALLAKITQSGFVEPTYIQEKSIPPIMEGKDVIGQSETGSGKTFAFGCGLISNISKGFGIGGIVLTPTRELAEQVSGVLEVFSKHKKLKVLPVYGGVSINPQIEKLRHADIVVATPGRLLDHIDRRTIDLSKIKILVLDEADRMVDMGFIDDVEKIIRLCPKKRQTLLFSATISNDIEEIKNKYMNNPISISARSQVDPTKLSQEYYDIDDRMKFSLLVHLLQNEHPGLIMVFCNTRNQVDFIAKNLRLNGLDATEIHGGFSQAKRSVSMKKFQDNKASILVCTDVAARGLDIQGVSHVYNYDMSKDAKEYIHRIGRTARAGKKGLVVNLISPRDHENFGRLQHMYSNLEIRNVDTPKMERAQMKVPTQASRDDSRGPRRFGNNRRGSSSNRRR
jgi:ATP-dependent RNA helicase DeaD